MKLVVNASGHKGRIGPKYVRIRPFPGSKDFTDFLITGTIVNVVEQIQHALVTLDGVKEKSWSRIDSYYIHLEGKNYIKIPCSQDSWICSKYLKKRWWVRFCNYKDNTK